MSIKDVLKQKRLDLNLTMKEVADRVGVSEGTISRWESGEIANMRRDKIMALANALHISPSVIMEWDDPNEKDNEDVLQTQDQAERDLLVLYRNGDLSDDEKAEVIDLFKSTLDVYYKAKGIKKSE